MSVFRYIAKDYSLEDSPLREILVDGGAPKPDGEGFVFKSGTIDSHCLSVVPDGMDAEEISDSVSVYGDEFPEERKLDFFRYWSSRVEQRARECGADVAYLSRPEIGVNPDPDLPSHSIFFASALVTFYRMR